MAEKLGYSVRYVRKLRALGVFCTKRTNKGIRYNLVGSLVNLAEYWKSKRSEDEKKDDFLDLRGIDIASLLDSLVQDSSY